jgi:hypothetical protein
MSREKHHRPSRVASSLLSVVGEKPSPTSTDKRPGRMTRNVARPGGDE